MDDLTDRRNHPTTSAAAGRELEAAPVPIGVAKTARSHLMPLNPATKEEIADRDRLEAEWAAHVQSLLDAGYIILTRQLDESVREGKYYRFNTFGRPPAARAGQD